MTTKWKKQNKKETETKETLFWNKKNRLNIQCSLLHLDLIHCIVKATQVWESVLDEWWCFLPVRQEEQIQHLFSALSGKPESAKTCPKAVCFTKKKIKDNTFQIHEKFLLCVFKHCRHPKHRSQKTSHGFWLLFLLCLTIICVIRVSIKHYEIQSVQIDISKAIFIHMGNIQPL